MDRSRGRYGYAFCRSGSEFRLCGVTLSLAQQTLLEAQSIRAQDSAILSVTARPPRDGSHSDESMIFAIMKP
ncbi:MULTISPECIES: hypothetical protein [unclassified Gluconobacter]|uniref:hypothetical protein n=1 Tax=unclassified Gluconobacter TaxID=2644261 RepID=UPI001C04588C|nr:MULTISPECIES: hypothetical protein [unclassified Gluconobacter]